MTSEPLTATLLESPFAPAEATPEPAGEQESWGHLYEAPGGEPAFEEQAAPTLSRLTRTFPPEALSELPDVLRAKPLVSAEVTVRTERILWMIAGARANVGAEPGWGDRLLVDLPDLPKAGPSSTVHVLVVETVPFDVVEQDKLRAFHRFCQKAHPSKVPPFDAVSVGPWTLNRWLEEALELAPGSLAAAAGLSTQLTVDQAATYKLVVYALLPRTVGAVVAPMDQRSLRGFPFAKATLTEEHERLIASLAREIVRSWYSRRIVTKIVVQGHTDPVGTRAYNLDLGRRRAQAVAARLKELVAQQAGRLPVGTVERIEYVIESYGEDRPFSTRLHTLNRRVEVTVYRDYTPPPDPLVLDEVIVRVTPLLSSPTLTPEAVKRLKCVLAKIKQPGMDDRFATDTQVFLIKRDNQMPRPEEWSRVLSRLLHPDLFGPQVPEDRLTTNLRLLDEDIAGGIVKMSQIIAYASGAEWGLGLLALPKAFKQFNAWIIDRLKDQASIYSCYAEDFLE